MEKLLEKKRSSQSQNRFQTNPKKPQRKRNKIFPSHKILKNPELNHSNKNSSA